MKESFMKTTLIRILLVLVILIVGCKKKLEFTNHKERITHVINSGEYEYLENITFTKEALEEFNKEELNILENMYSAKNGFKFKNEFLAKQFLKFKWYKPTENNVDNKLTEAEKQNIKIIDAQRIRIENLQKKGLLDFVTQALFLPSNSEEELGFRHIDYYKINGKPYIKHPMELDPLQSSSQTDEVQYGDLQMSRCRFPLSNFYLRFLLKITNYELNILPTDYSYCADLFPFMAEQNYIQAQPKINQILGIKYVVKKEIIKCPDRSADDSDYFYHYNPEFLKRFFYQFYSAPEVSIISNQTNQNLYNSIFKKEINLRVNALLKALKSEETLKQESTEYIKLSCDETIQRNSYYHDAVRRFNPLPEDFYSFTETEQEKFIKSLPSDEATAFLWRRTIDGTLPVILGVLYKFTKEYDTELFNQVDKKLKETKYVDKINVF
jgi:hypothetical protein